MALEVLLTNVKSLLMINMGKYSYGILVLTVVDNGSKDNYTWL